MSEINIAVIDALEFLGNASYSTSESFVHKILECNLFENLNIYIASNSKIRVQMIFWIFHNLVIQNLPEF
jgi:hypothetical protein